MKRKIVVVLAHPDDESFPIGGTLAKYSAEGSQIVLVSATRGEAGIRDVSPAETAKIREAELNQAAKYLGISRVIFLDYSDGELNLANEENAVENIKKIILDEQPDVIVTFGADGISGHPDHVAIHRITTEAFHRSGSYGRLFYIMPSEATLQGCGITPPGDPLVGPVVGIDIGDYRIPKVMAIQSHASQNPPYQGDPIKLSESLTCHEYFIHAQQKNIVENPIDLFN